MAHFLAMGKYAAFVWPAYGVSAFGMVIAIVLTVAAYSRAKEQLKSLDQRAR